jgi:hypothetical protein
MQSVSVLITGIQRNPIWQHLAAERPSTLTVTRDTAE